MRRIFTEKKKAYQKVPRRRGGQVQTICSGRAETEESCSTFGEVEPLNHHEDISSDTKMIFPSLLKVKGNLRLKQKAEDEQNLSGKMLLSDVSDSSLKSRTAIIAEHFCTKNYKSHNKENILPCQVVLKGSNKDTPRITTKENHPIEKVNNDSNEHSTESDRALKKILSGLEISLENFVLHASEDTTKETTGTCSSAGYMEEKGLPYSKEAKGYFQKANGTINDESSEVAEKVQSIRNGTETSGKKIVVRKVNKKEGAMEQASEITPRNQTRQTGNEDEAYIVSALNADEFFPNSSADSKRKLEELLYNSGKKPGKATSEDKQKNNNRRHRGSSIQSSKQYIGCNAVNGLFEDCSTKSSNQQMVRQKMRTDKIYDSQQIQEKNLTSRAEERNDNENVRSVWIDMRKETMEEKNQSSFGLRRSTNLESAKNYEAMFAIEIMPIPDEVVPLSRDGSISTLSHIIDPSTVIITDRVDHDKDLSEGHTMEGTRFADEIIYNIGNAVGGTLDGISEWFSK